MPKTLWPHGSRRPESETQTRGRDPTISSRRGQLGPTSPASTSGRGRGLWAYLKPKASPMKGAGMGADTEGFACRSGIRNPTDGDADEFCGENHAPPFA